MPPSTAPNLSIIYIGPYLITWQSIMKHNSDYEIAICLHQQSSYKKNHGLLIINKHETVSWSRTFTFGEQVCVLTVDWVSFLGDWLVSYTMGIGVSFPAVKRPGHEADHSPPSSSISLHGVVFSYFETTWLFFCPYLQHLVTSSIIGLQDKMNVQLHSHGICRWAQPLAPCTDTVPTKMLLLLRAGLCTKQIVF